jgi:hypothetical protein
MICTLAKYRYHNYQWNEVGGVCGTSGGGGGGRNAYRVWWGKPEVKGQLGRQ